MNRLVLICIADYATPIVAGLKDFHRIRWQINRQTFRSRRRDQIERELVGAAHQE